jgi:hypothetical protein
MVEGSARAELHLCSHDLAQILQTDKTRPAGAGCDQLIGESKRGNVLGPLEATDRVRLDVKISGGVEIGSWVGASEFDSRNILDLVHGSFESGTLGPLLQDIFENEGTESEFNEQKGTEMEYSFHVPVATSHYRVRAAGDRFDELSYGGTLRIDSESFDLRYVDIKIYDLPPEANACLITTSANYRREAIGQGVFRMPTESVFQALRTDSSTSETALVYSNCREYHAESTIRPGVESAVEPTPADVAKLRQEPPAAGLKFSVAFNQPIDSDTAAGGDPITVELEEFETPAGWAPIYAKPDEAGATARATTETAELKATRDAYFFCLRLGPLGLRRRLCSGRMGNDGWSPPVTSRIGLR